MQNFSHDLYIKAVNPGYTLDGISNVGEMLEIARQNPDAPPISLAGITVGYTNSSGNYTALFEFPEYSWFAGETILLRLASSPEHELAAATYKKTLAMSASLSLKFGDETLDEVCWTGKSDCYPAFKSATPTTLVRNLATAKFERQPDYIPVYDEKSYYVETIDEPSEELSKPSQCKGLEFSEILSYYDTSKSEQFIELHNYASEQILLDGCQLKYKNKLYPLTGIVKPDAYHAYFPLDFNLTKNPTTSNTIELIDTNDDIIDTLTYPNGQKKSTAYALIGYNQDGTKLWRTTFAPTPGQPNNYQEFRTCEEGKVINEATGNCVKPTTITTKSCKAGYFLNPLTGRCNKIPTLAVKTCKEGYELNPDTNRCRKIKENTGANYVLTPETYVEESSFIALYAVLAVAAIGLCYLIYEFRREIAKLFGKFFRRAR
ncbi:hypothetical protein IKF57_02185 [Candidatus Saccharibacteria bacterium]|nr:hypothetical protein [Candidatus Saccharibacteria bacterium]